MKTYRIMTYNIRHGQGMDDVLDLARTARVITAEAPDLVAVQELDRGTTRVGRSDQLAELGRLTGLHPAFSKSIDYQGGAYGNAVLSRFPILAEHRCPLPGRECRSALACDMVVPDLVRLRFVSTHLDLEAGPRLASTGVLLDFLAGLLPMPTVLCGDLNALPDGPTLRAFTQAGWQAAGGDRLSPTYPADEPEIRIDYILSRGLTAAMGLGDARRINETLVSDHRPVMATLTLA